MKNKVTILVIEDDRDLQELYKEFFTKSGYTVLQAYDGQEGLDILEKNDQIKTILVDIMLPRISGYEVISRIRRDALKANIPVLVVTALSDPEERKRGEALGVKSFLTKGDNTMREIVDAVDRLALS